MKSSRNDNWKHDTLKLKPIRQSDVSFSDPASENGYVSQKKSGINGYTITLIVIATVIVCLSVILALVDNSSDISKPDTEKPDIIITDDNSEDYDIKDDSAKEVDKTKEEDKETEKDELEEETKETESESKAEDTADANQTSDENPNTTTDNNESLNTNSGSNNDAPSDIPDISELE